MSEDSRTDARQTADALADLFDTIPPSDRTSAEEELRAAGNDPAAVGRRLAVQAHNALAARESARRDAQPSPRISHIKADHIVTKRRPWVTWVVRLAAVVVVMVAIGWLGSNSPRETVVARIPQPRPAPSLPMRRPPPKAVYGESPGESVLGNSERSVSFADAVKTAIASEQRPGRPERVDGSDQQSLDASEAETQLAGGATRRAGGEGRSWVLDNSNWQEAEGLLPPAVLARVKSGDYWYRVDPVDASAFKQNYSDRFWQASEANAGKYDIDASTCGLKDVATGKMPEFYFGYPFPHIDPQDPAAACKMAWNFEAANSMGEGQGSTFTLNGVGASGEFKRIKLALETMSFLGRHGGPIDNPENLRSTLLSHLLEPQDVDGVGGITKRANDWEQEDKVWFFVPSTRRVRRANAAAVSDPIAGLDIYADDVNCYGGKIEYYRWKLVGQQNILAPIVAARPLAQRKTNSETRFTVGIPYVIAAYEQHGAKGVQWLPIDNLVLAPRPVWVIEGESGDPAYNFGKVIMYMDRDLYRIYWKLVYKRSGEYFYNAMCAYHTSKSADGSFSAVTQTLVVGVNDQTNRACVAGRATSQFIERQYSENHFSLNTLTALSHGTD